MRFLSRWIDPKIVTGIGLVCLAIYQATRDEWGLAWASLMGAFASFGWSMGDRRTAQVEQKLDNRIAHVENTVLPQIVNSTITEESKRG